MIDIKIPEVYYSEDPKQPPIKRSEHEVFVEGFKKLCAATQMNKLNYNTLFDLPIISQLIFEDGSMIGIRKLFEEVGFNL